MTKMAPKFIALSKQIVTEALLVWVVYFWYRVLVTEVGYSVVWPIPPLQHVIENYGLFMQNSLRFLYPEVGQVMVFSLQIVLFSALLCWLMVMSQLPGNTNDKSDASETPN